MRDRILLATVIRSSEIRKFPNKKKMLKSTWIFNNLKSLGYLRIFIL